LTIAASLPLPPDLLAAVGAAKGRAVPVRLDVRWFASVASTMDVAAAAVDAGADEGLVIVADEQTHGRGRRGRVWSSPPGAGVYLTFVFRPPLEGSGSPVVTLLTLAAGVAVRAAIGRATGFAPELKWPNDVMIGRRKLAGILSEGIGLGTAGQAVLVGIGLNLLSTAHPGDIAARAVSLEAELGRVVDRAKVFEELLVAVPGAYDDLRCGKADDILRAWRDAAPSAAGCGVEWQTDDGVRRGTTAGIDAHGALLVKTSSGVERVLAGELTWV
jgi:BirA family biotin operon repressor/biotin-[acetyl-CoA-carboxylase] ligase